MTASLVEPVTSGRGGAVARYAVAATAARIGDAGTGIGVLLLAVQRGGASGPAVGGLLAAAVTVPHVLGPWVGRLLDRHDPRRVLALACLVFGAALAVATTLLGAGHMVWSVPAFLLAGAAGPLLTGGFSSFVTDLGADRGRARGIDALTYGVAGTAGPALVAGVAAATSPAGALFVVSGVVVLAAGGTLTLPVRGTATVTDGSSSATLLFRSRPLRRVTVVTAAAAAAGGALGVVAVLLAVEVTGSSGGGAWFVAALGVGNLVGALWVTWRPLHREPVASSLRLAAALAFADLAVALVPSFGLGLVVFAVVGILTAPFVAATLEARDRYAPEGRRREVFVAMSGLKVAAGAGGTALAGLASAWGARPLAVAGGGVVVLAVLGVSRRAAARRPAPA